MQGAGERRLGVAKDLHHGPPCFGAEMRVPGCGVASGQHGHQPRDDEVARGGGERIEHRRVDGVAERIPHQPTIEREVAQRSAFRVAGPARRKGRGEAGIALDAGRERRLVHEQQVVGQRRCRFAYARVISQSRFPIEPCHQVGGVGLMLEHHQRDDVAGGGEVAGGVEFPRHAGQPGGRPRAWHRLDQLDVAAVLLGHGCSGDEPAAPSLGNRRPVIDRAAVRESVSALARQRGPHRRTGYAERVPGEVTRHAVLLPPEPRLLRRLLRNRIENGPLPRILGGDFQQIGAANPADSHRVVEVEGARVLLVDLAGLKAGLGIHQHLRRHRHVQRLEHRRQVTGLGVESQRHRSMGQALVQFRHRGVRGRTAIRDGRMVPATRRTRRSAGRPPTPSCPPGGLPSQ